MSADVITIASRLHGPRIFRRAGYPQVRTRKRLRRVDLWITTCAVCEAEFEIEAGPRSGHGFHVVTCPLHCMTRSETGRLRSKDTGAARKAFEQIRAAKLAADAKGGTK
jgi:hypothetical protein